MNRSWKVKCRRKETRIGLVCIFGVTAGYDQYAHDCEEVNPEILYGAPKLRQHVNLQPASDSRVIGHSEIEELQDIDVLEKEGSKCFWGTAVISFCFACALTFTWFTWCCSKKRVESPAQQDSKDSNVSHEVKIVSPTSGEVTKKKVESPAQQDSKDSKVSHEVKVVSPTSGEVTKKKVESPAQQDSKVSHEVKVVSPTSGEVTTSEGTSITVSATGESATGDFEVGSTSVTSSTTGLSTFTTADEVGIPNGIHVIIPFEVLEVFRRWSLKHALNKGDKNIPPLIILRSRGLGYLLDGHQYTLR